MSQNLPTKHTSSLDFLLSASVHPVTLVFLVKISEITFVVFLKFTQKFHMENCTNLDSQLHVDKHTESSQKKKNIEF